MAKMNYNENALDLFRVIATVQIFMGHVITHFDMAGPPVSLVYFLRGVPILFVICGFLAAKALEKYDPKEWLLRRAVRILPGFWCCILINSAIIRLVYANKPTAIERLIYAVTQFFGMNFYTGGWLRGYGVGTPNGALWTIPVQIQFFALAPLLYRHMKKSSPRNVMLIIGGFTIFSIAVEKSAACMPELLYKLIGVTVFPYLYFLALGMAIWVYRNTLIPALKVKKWGILVAYVLWKWMEIYMDFPRLLDGVLYNTLTVYLTAVLVFSFGFSFTWRMKRDDTFGFYLYHMVFVNLAIHFGFGRITSVWQGFATVGLVAAATWICAVLSNKYVEQPLTRILLKKG